MSIADSTDILHQEEKRIRARFAFFGAEALQAIERVFARFGHFRPLLSHLKLSSEGDLEIQQETLTRCLHKCGPEIFMLAIEKGENPLKLLSETPFSVADDLTSTKLVLGLQNDETSAERDDVNTASAPLLKPTTDDRRQRAPGRRQKVTLDYPNCRRRDSRR